MHRLKKVCHNVSRKKSFNASTSMETKLERSLTTFHLIIYGLASMAGTGIYVLIGHIIKNKAGPAANLSFLIGGVSSVFTGMCYCEFASLIPKAGSCYTYTYLLIGELPAFIISWCMILDIMVGTAAVAKGFSGTLNLLTDGAIFNFTEAYLPLVKGNAVFDSSADIVSFGLILVLVLISISGANISLTLNAILTLLQTLCLVTVIITCFICGNSDNYKADGGYAPFGFFGVLKGAGIVIFAYSGFENLANAAEETKNPKRSIPIAMFVSLSIIIVLYICTSSGLSFMVPRLSINEKAPFVSAMTGQSLIPIKWVAGIGALLATGVTKLSYIYVIPRMIYAVSIDGLIFRLLGWVDKRTRMPIIALFCGSSVSMVLALFVRIEVLADITSMGVLLSYTMIGVDLMVFRYTYLNEKPSLQMRVFDHDFLKSRTAFYIVFTFFLFSLVVLYLVITFVMSMTTIVGTILVTLIATTTMTTLIILCLYEPMPNEMSFSTPIMPMSPLITIAINLYLLINLSPATWIRFFVWLIFGLIIYFSYGMWYSELAEKPEEYTELDGCTKTD